MHISAQPQGLTRFVHANTPSLETVYSQFLFLDCVVPQVCIIKMLHTIYEILARGSYRDDVGVRVSALQFIHQQSHGIRQNYKALSELSIKYSPHRPHLLIGHAHFVTYAGAGQFWVVIYICLRSIPLPKRTWSRKDVSYATMHTEDGFVKSAVSLNMTWLVQSTMLYILKSAAKR
jgi:hypothetical protein